MDDLMLWGRLRKGDHGALREMYTDHVVNLENYARKFKSDNVLIEDTIHDIFVQIWNQKERLGNTDSIIKYLCVTLRREIIRRISKAQKVTELKNQEGLDADFSISIEDILISEETKDDHHKKLKKALDTLSSRQREAIYLRYYEEMDYEEICEIMEINYQSVRNLISKGVTDLRKYLTPAIFFVTMFF